MTALTDWADALAAWAIPDAIAHRATDSPWVLPRQVFIRRADAQIAQPAGATYAAAVTALSTPGTVLDVGAAAGATSLPLIGRSAAQGLTGVDADPELLASVAWRSRVVDAEQHHVRFADGHTMSIDQGVTPVPGPCVLGQPWQRTSGIRPDRVRRPRRRAPSAAHPVRIRCDQGVEIRTACSSSSRPNATNG